MDVAAYLRRIRYDGPIDPTAATLRGLHAAHLRAVPFENLSIHAGEPIVLDDAALFEKIVTRRRGGFCYELNGLFAALLRQLGFDLVMLSAGVVDASGEFGPEFDHMTLLVRPGIPEAPDDPWLADVGFGDAFLDPLRFGATDIQTQGRDRWLLTSDAAGRWTLMRAIGPDGLRPQYRFTTTPRAIADYAEMCAFHQTSPHSPFTRQRLCTIATDEGRLTLAGLRFVRTRDGIREERALADDHDFDRLLREHFGIEPASVTPARRDA